METSDFTHVVRLLAGLAERYGFADGMENALSEGPDARTMGQYERMHLGLGDFTDIPALLETIADSVDPHVTARARGEARELLWGRYITGYNKGTRLVVPGAKEAGED